MNVADALSGRMGLPGVQWLLLAAAPRKSLGQELAALWERSNESREQLLARLQDWCHRAEESGIVPLQNFSRRLRSYA